MSSGGSLTPCQGRVIRPRFSRVARIVRQYVFGRLELFTVQPLLFLSVTAGVPDVLAWHAGKSSALELKDVNGRVSDAQIDMLARLDRAGVITAVACRLDRGIAILERWELLRGRMQ
jgi:hypothetical protein